MRMVDLIHKKRAGEELAKDEIGFIVTGFTKGDIPNYQMSAFLMAVCFNGMTKRETADLTLAMAESGDMVDLSAISGIKVDKHSTGGVGDKTTLIISPIAAACGAPVAKMSGRGLGHTGGTVDKLEAIPGLKTAFTQDEFISMVKSAGLSVVGQSGNMAPADKKIYALRDVTATVESLPLIASSIMSKKIAAGSDAIVLDVKTGSGAFMKTLEDSIKLAKEMVDIGCLAGRETVALITDMDVPLGNNIGNSLEIIEAAETLKGKGPADLLYVCKALAKEMLMLAGKGSAAECDKMVNEAIDSGKAFNKLVDMVKAQGGDTEVLFNTDKFPKAKYMKEALADSDGYISHMNVEEIGIASSILGAGREKEDSVIDYSAGIILSKKTGDEVKKGDLIARLYSNDMDKLKAGSDKFSSALRISNQAPDKGKLIYAKVSSEGVVQL